MSAPAVSLLMAIHCHQPVGNFGFVFEEAFRNAYEPFLATLERHPAIRVSLHYSGSLLDWLLDHQPGFLDRIRRLVAQGQVELLAAGYYEPILPLIPEADRQGQLALMRRTLRRRFGCDATGLWLTERVWEPELPRTLAHAGIRYTMLDVNQFQPIRALLPAHLQVHDEQGWDLLGCYVTEYAGEAMTLFPASQRLRYWMPFQEGARTVEFLKRLVRQEPVAITFADDGEKFGLWPKTHAWVYEEGWLEQFFCAVEREASWLTTTTFSDYLNAVGSSGRVYLPCGSYEEMLEWSGGYFRNFFVRYPEANAMHQRMLAVSRALQGAASEKRKAGLAQAQRELYMAQCNCAYWHGVFGGLYLAHLRRAVYQHLLGAERALAQAVGRRAWREHVDVDGDGRPEAILRSHALRVVVDPQDDGTVTELDFYPKTVNLLDTLSRRYEPYHEHLKATRSAAASGERQAPASIHELVKVKEPGLETALVYDDHRRSSFRDYALAVMPRLEDLLHCAWGEQRLWSSGAWDVQPASGGRRAVDRSAIVLSRRIHDGRLRKTVAVWRKEPRLAFGYQIVDVAVPVVGLEFNLSLRDARWLAPTWHEELEECQVQDPSQGVGVRIRLDPAGTVAMFPIETVSESEQGLERTFQGLAFVALWPTHGARRWAGTVEWTVEAL
ncbi:MAG: DUF1926 domain-containing protein [Candidatus Omnitrophica bacterium]|nr:DUF1926 domain-containing protein [Candidatus Omnitrophota bacterium]